MSAAAAVLACALACALWPPAAHGAEATAAEVRALAAAAPRDPAALERLRAIDTVDGRPAQLASALDGTRDEVTARVRALAQDRPPPASGTSSAAARDEARDVLAQRRFQPTSVPAPLREVRERVGEALVSLGGPLERAFRWLAERVPAAPPVLWALLATLVLATAALLAGRAGTPHEGERVVAGAAPGEEHMSAARLRQEAERAERAGELEEALRLRFRAGLVELDRRELIALRPALTNRELLDAVSSPTLAELVDGFEAVAYGGRPAGEEDLLSARDGWPRVPEEASRR